MFAFGQKGLAWKGASEVTEALKTFFVSRGSADRDISVDRQTIALRARSLYQNSAFSGALINTLDINVVGTGLKLRPIVPQELLGIDRKEAHAWEKKAQSLFELWASSKKCDTEKKADFHEIQSLALKTQLITGDAFVLTKYDYSANPFGLCLKLLEADRCQNPFGMMDSQRLAQGVEVDNDGAAVAYHFTTVPPYNIDNYFESIETVRVPAFDSFGYPNVIHCFTADRTDQRRGISALAPIISQVKQQERYQDAELIAAVVSALFTVFLESNNSDEAPEMDSNVPDDEKVSGMTGPKAPVEMIPGGIVELPYGYKVSLANPSRPNVNYKPFVDSIFCEAAARVGVSYEVVLKQFSTNYNAVRAAILESKKTFNRIKKNFVSDFCQPIYEKWLYQAVLTGIIEVPGFLQDALKRSMWSRCAWIGDSAFLLDPLKETQAIKMQVDEQFMSRNAAVTAVTGGAYERVMDELAEEKEGREQRGLPEPGAVNKTESVSLATVEDGDEKKNEDE
jgi:lambda family phage portal protein